MVFAAQQAPDTLSGRTPSFFQSLAPQSDSEEEELEEIRARKEIHDAQDAVSDNATRKHKLEQRMRTLVNSSHDLAIAERKMPPASVEHEPSSVNASSQSSATMTAVSPVSATEATKQGSAADESREANPDAPVVDSSLQTSLVEDDYESDDDTVNQTPPRSDFVVANNEDGSQDRKRGNESLGLSSEEIRRLGLKRGRDDSTAMQTVTASDLREMDWEFSMNSAKLAPRTPVSGSRLEKSRHQIGWLAASAAHDEDTILAASARMRDAKKNTRAKYGW